MELGFLPYQPFSLTPCIAESTIPCQLMKVFMADALKQPLCNLWFMSVLV